MCMNRAIRREIDNPRNMDVSPEQEYIQNLDEISKNKNQPADFVQRKIKTYIEAINENLGEKAGINKYLCLAESHRRVFHPRANAGRVSNPLSERKIALPITDMYSIRKFQRMEPNGEVSDVEPHGMRSWHPRYAQPPYRMAGCPFSNGEM